MADVKLNDLQAVTDLAFAYVERSGGAQGKISKGDLSRALSITATLDSCDLNTIGVGVYTLSNRVNTYTNAPTALPYNETNSVLVVYNSLLQVLYTRGSTLSASFIRNFVGGRWGTWSRLDESPTDLKATTITDSLSYVYGEKSDGTQGRVSVDSLQAINWYKNSQVPSGVTCGIKASTELYEPATLRFQSLTDGALEVYDIGLQLNRYYSPFIITSAGYKTNKIKIYAKKVQAGEYGLVIVNTGGVAILTFMGRSTALNTINVDTISNFVSDGYTQIV